MIQPNIKSKSCDRCLTKTNTYKMSWFNSDSICMECDAREHKHPMIALAKRIELEFVLNKEYNYTGIGLPSENFTIEIMEKDQWLSGLATSIENLEILSLGSCSPAGIWLGPISELKIGESWIGEIKNSKAKVTRCW